jgi:hypothetical protein
MVAIPKPHQTVFAVLLSLGLMWAAGLRAATVKEVRVEKKGDRYWLEIDADASLSPQVTTAGDRLILKIKAANGWAGIRCLCAKGPSSRCASETIRRRESFTWWWTWTKTP